MFPVAGKESTAFPRLRVAAKRLWVVSSFQAVSPVLAFMQYNLPSRASLPYKNPSFKTGVLNEPPKSGLLQFSEKVYSFPDFSILKERVPGPRPVTITFCPSITGVEQF